MIVSLLLVPVTLVKLLTVKEMIGGVAIPVFIIADFATKLTLIVAAEPKLVAVEASITFVLPVAPIMLSMLVS